MTQTSLNSFLIKIPNQFPLLRSGKEGMTKLEIGIRSSSVIKVLKLILSKISLRINKTSRQIFSPRFFCCSFFTKFLSDSNLKLLFITHDTRFPVYLGLTQRNFARTRISKFERNRNFVSQHKLLLFGLRMSLSKLS